mmetsp:Transcript_28507/g.93142  ORF Transcript_28507/g.93142 Transcript_28507/m.93142 type:complete len:182 (+) Transcript_28507:54-599(+)|eukprot:CAMPEP_0170138108 /NCGR_PEP_ID=MMETSP0033_2-20121228/4657_1 /TAXON_ID=195969 /ORGANISM="Dolichomastix tenuilepis, Strain CCMP3274" /LENGTH=181 /DNA_ID=CAMNT_0010374075 /DNA_START=146 /DNA_END=691 /DNA_ORIENTATION=-
MDATSLTVRAQCVSAHSRHRHKIARARASAAAAEVGASAEHGRRRALASASATLALTALITTSEGASAAPAPESYDADTYELIAAAEAVIEAREKSVALDADIARFKSLFEVWVGRYKFAHGKHGDSYAKTYQASTTLSEALSPRLFFSFGADFNPAAPPFQRDYLLAQLFFAKTELPKGN